MKVQLLHKNEDWFEEFDESPQYEDYIELEDGTEVQVAARTWVKENGKRRLVLILE